MNKDMKELRKLALDQGWRVEDGNSGHSKWYPPDGGQFTSAGNHPKPRGFKNLRRRLEKKGLVVPGREHLHNGYPDKPTPQSDAKQKDEDMRKPNSLHQEICAETVGILRQAGEGVQMSSDKLRKRLKVDCTLADVNNALGKATHTDARRMERGQDPRWPGLSKVPHRQALYTYAPLPDPTIQPEAAPAVTVPPTPLPAPTSAPTPTGDAPVTPEATDDELWALLEMLLDGPVPMNRDTLALVNDWMDATRKLKALTS